MIKSNSSAIGIIFSNTYDALVPDLVNVRLMASIPFASRYRMIDFLLSSMSNCGIDDINIMVNKNYHSLMDHLGSGREWDLVRKNGGLSIFPPSSERGAVANYSGKIDALAGILGVLRSRKEKYIVMADANLAVNMDFYKMIAAHEASGADVTVAYNVVELPESARKSLVNDKGLYYTFEVEEGRVTKININSRAEGLQNFGMNIYVIDRELMINLIEDAYVHGHQYFERDILANQLAKLNVQGYKYEGYVARISSIKSYFDENMKLLDDKNLDALFAPAPIYTKIRDDNPTRYVAGAKVSNSMLADGCVIEGEVENSVIFRGVKVAKGAKVSNCILMQDTVVEAGADLSYTITDKDVLISAGKELKGSDTYPMYVAKGKTV